MPTIHGVTLTDADIDRIAACVVELLRADPTISEASNGTARLTAKEYAERLGVSREYVYAHKFDLGGEPIGSGPRPRWRFPEPASNSQTSGDSADPNPRENPNRPRVANSRRRKSSRNVRLLDVRGTAPYGGPQNKAAPGGAVTPTEGLDTGGGSSHAHD